MQFKRPSQPRRRLIGLTPLIDVVFILLLFFMLASSLTRLHAVPLDAPSAQMVSGDRQPALLLRIQADGQLDLNGEAINTEALPELLRTQLQQAPNLQVLVQPADAVPLQRTLQVFDQLAAVGVPLLRLR
ncbi:MAG: biopolymer transporter ExbD [Halochromatium sp.]|nr:biopolymer transporter ExbD [Halochromatium sp.]